MTKKLIDMGPELTQEIKNLDAQIRDRAQHIAQETNILRALELFKKVKLHRFATDNGLQGAYDLTDDYFLKESDSIPSDQGVPIPEPETEEEPA